jgi:putative endonuclease
MAEESACRFLQANGYRIIARKYKAKFSEIDIIAQDGATHCFIEVKARSSDRFGSPLEAVSSRKQQKIIMAAQNFLKERNLDRVSCRFDVVGVLIQEGKPSFELIKNAFESNE